MNRFNLTFSGEIVEGQDMELVKLRFAKKFAIDDPARLERFFSGETVTLRRNLERKDAAQFYHELQLIGVVAALVKAASDDDADVPINRPPPTKSSRRKPAVIRRRTARAAVPPASRRDNQQRQPASAGADESNTHAASETAAPDGAVSWTPDGTDIAAQIKARKLAAQQLAADKAAQEQAALAAQQREIAAAAEREQALAAERLRLAEEERARQEAERARLAAEEAARKEAERAEIRRQEAAEAARKKALKAAARRKAAEEAAQRKARRNQEKAEKARLKAEEAARRQAELEEKKRLAAEEEARRKTELEERKRLAAEEEARRRAALEEKKRLAAEEAARRAAAEAEEDARLRVELEAIKRREAEEAARLQAELDEKAREAAAQAARIKAEAQRLQEEAQRRSEERRRIAAEALAARQQRDARNDAAGMSVQPPPVDHVRQLSLKPAKSRVKTALEVPLRGKGEMPEIGVPGPRKRQSGEPNLYKLRPFRNSETVRTRAAHARRRMRHAYTITILALAALLIAGGSYLRNAGKPAITGTSAIAINANSEPLLLAGDTLLLHDRAGVGTTEVPLSALGVSALVPPLVFDGEDTLFARGRLADTDADPAQRDALQLLRCDPPLSRCTPFSPQLQDSRIDAFVLNPLDNSVLLADRTAGQLLKVDSAGTVVARADVTLPDEPVLRLHGGLLLMNSVTGPAISVFRYEDDAFAKQLDEILLLPPSAETLEETHVGDFVWSGDAWWVNLRTTGAGPGELHRFDEEWNYLSTVPLAAGAGPVQLVNWGQKTLVNDPRHPAIPRYNAQGEAEVPFASTPLQNLVGAQQQRAGIARAAWHGGLLLCALAAVLGFGFAYWHGLRNLVYRPRREQGAEPLDDHAAALRWIEPVQNRPLQLRRSGIYYGLGALGVLLLAIALNVSVAQMGALLVVLSGPAIALLLLGRQPTGYIGVLGDRLLLVDHSGMYHLAGGSRLQYHGPFLAIDDIVVFSGSRRLPAFSPAPLQQHVTPLALGGIRVDRRTIAIKLLECRHPLALGAVAMVAAAAAAALLLLLPHIF